MSFGNLKSIHGRQAGLAAPINGAGMVIVRGDGSQDSFGCYRQTTISSAQVLALFGTPQTVVPAPGAGLAIVPYKVVIHKPAGTAYGGVAVGEDLVLKYTNASGAQVSAAMETTGFLDSASALTMVAGMPNATGSTPGGFLAVANAPVVLHLLVGEVTTGDSPLIVRVWYDVIRTAFS